MPGPLFEVINMVFYPASLWDKRKAPKDQHSKHIL